MNDAGILSGLTVVDFGQYLAGPLVATLLADQGAHVIHIDPPGGPRMRHPANAFLMRGREIRSVDLADPAEQVRMRELMDRADIVIENFRPGVMARMGLDLAEARERNGRLITCSLPGFPQDDPRRDRAGWEGVVMAASGAYWRYAGTPGYPPPLDGPSSVRFSQLPLASVTAACLGAYAIAGALVARNRDGVGQHVEVPLADAMLELNGIMAIRMEHPDPADPWLAFGLGLYRGSDGRVLNLNCVQYRHLAAALDAAGVADWRDDELFGYDRLKEDEGARNALRDRLSQIIAARPAGEWEAILQSAGVPCGLVRSAEEWMMSDAPLAAGTLTELCDPETGRTRMPGAAIGFSLARSDLRPRGEASDASVADPVVPGHAETRDPPLHALRVLDLTRVVAAPTSSRLLADLGADVLKVDVDPATARAAAAEPIAHLYVNRGKRGLVLDLKTDSGRTDFVELLRSADMIVTNFRLASLAAIGLDEDGLRAVNPDIIISYLNAFGRSGPWATYRGYAEVINAITGIADMTSGWGHKPSGAHTVNDPPWPYTDSVAGIISAFGAVLAVFDRGRTGRAQHVEASLAMAGALELLPYSVVGQEHVWDEPMRGDRLGWSPRQRIFAVKDGWLFLHVHDQDEPELLRRLGITDASGIEEALRGLDSWTADLILNFGRTSSSPSEPPAKTLEPGSIVDRRGLRLQARSDRNGTIVTQAAVVHLSRTPARAGDMAAPFGSEDKDAVVRWFRA